MLESCGIYPGRVLEWKAGQLGWRQGTRKLEKFNRRFHGAIGGQASCGKAEVLWQIGGSGSWALGEWVQGPSQPSEGAGGKQSAAWERARGRFPVIEICD